ncbi:glycosyltransferase [Flavimarina sp. Hel_I_48]|uniref:glycosyltransferase n=1 Tax=Flavimarina sp. Hel_I_48 TaxID=1392488 RepID=UPI0004DF2CEC|nr:glycosyltransferase [Flavimarina sp. Hel_I_48]
MSSKAEIAILIPHFNNPQGLLKSIKSIQEDIALDVIIVDDGSTNERINEVALDIFENELLKLHYIYLSKNSGIENALNTGLNYILNRSYSFIARLDCGDLCVSHRFAIQKKVLCADKALGLVGTYVKYINLEGEVVHSFKTPTSYGEVRNKMHINSMFVHPTVMIKREVVENVGLYPYGYPAAEDFAYFFKIIKTYKAFNIPQYLLYYEINPNGISLSRRKEQLNSRFKILKEEFYWGFYPCYGIVRNFIISKLPYSLIHKLKKILR